MLEEMIMSKCWIKTDFVPEDSKDYITENKWYEVELEASVRFLR